jgi:heme-degrading monooxygenase HmoA
MIIVATELHVRNFWRLFPFIRMSAQAMKQAKQSTGCLHATATNGGWRIGYTLTAWDSREAMLQFRNSGPHKTAMQQTARLSKRYKTEVWEAAALPSFKEAKQRLQQISFKEIRG